MTSDPKGNVIMNIRKLKVKHMVCNHEYGAFGGGVSGKSDICLACV